MLVDRCIGQMGIQLIDGCALVFVRGKPGKTTTVQENFEGTKRSTEHIQSNVELVTRDEVWFVQVVLCNVRGVVNHVFDVINQKNAAPL